MIPTTGFRGPGYSPEVPAAVDMLEPKDPSLKTSVISEFNFIDIDHNSIIPLPIV